MPSSSTATAGCSWRTRSLRLRRLIGSRPAGRSWYANCGWDAFGIGVVLRTDSTIHTECADCGEAIDLEVRDYRPSDASPLFHVLVPARDWWSDIGFT